MDTNQNQLTNTFTKGMNTDTSDMYLSSELYRYAENIRIVTNTDSNTGEIRIVEGTEELFTYNDNIIATNSIRDIAIFITIDPNELHQDWSVWKKVGDNKAKCILANCQEKLWNDGDSIDKIRKSVTTVLRWESEKNIKLYIADSTGKHSIMVLNIADQYSSSDFNELFAYQRTLLPPPEVNISEGSGSITSGKVQYVYRLYSKNGAATPLSILSKTLSLYKNEYEGYEAEKRSGRAVDITIPMLGNNLDYIQIYRISYQISGQLPKISLIKDEKVTETFIDVGTDIEEIAISEVLSMFTPFIYPKQIESKGDYLFAANMKYSQDDVDDKFVNFDAISYSRHNGITVDENNMVVTPNFDDLNLDNLTSQAFIAGVTPSYNESHWKSFNVGSIECNGYGKYICWKYIYDKINIDDYTRHPLPSKQSVDINYQKSTFRCGETYRFGIKLYDEYGRASSVKWIADIIIPYGANMFIDPEQGSETMFRNIGIQFFKTPGSVWPTNISGWEIVRCERKLQDRKAITQGIIGCPLECYQIDNNDSYNVTDKLSFEDAATDERNTNLMCNPGFFSTDFFSALSLYRFSIPSKDTLMFSSPESCYQEDDIKDILKANSSDLNIEYVYKCSPKSKTEDYEIQSDYNPGKRIFTDLILNERMSFGFFWPYDHYSIYKNSDWRFIENYNSTYAMERGVLKKYADNATTRFYFNYFTPDYDKVEHPQIIAKINNISNIDSPQYSDFANDELFTYKNNTTTILNKLFINWSWPLLLNSNGEEETEIKSFIDNINPGEIYGLGSEVVRRILYPVGAGGKLILFNVNKSLITNGDENHAPSISVVNVTKNTTPYGGYNKTAINNSSYISFGDYTTANSIDIYSGDTKNRVFTYNALHTWYDPTYKNCIKMATVYAIPVETDIDIQAQYGLLYGVDNFYNYNIQDEACAFDNYTQNKNAYLYNTAYNATPDIINWTTLEQLESRIDQFDTRIHYSNVKINNEDIDSWLLFQAANYIDVDTRYGEITDLKLFKDKLIFWQENATGMLAVNERVVLNDLNDTQVVLGTGGVLERYDYFTTIYGQKKNQHVRAISNTSLYWWDGNSKEILVHLDKYDVIPLSTIKNVKNYINNNNESETPFMTYDNKYKEILMNVVGNETLVYNEQIDAFTSIYTFCPIFDVLINNKLLLTSSYTIYNYNQSNGASTLFEEKATPKVRYVVNNQPMYNKVFDIQTFGGRFYGGSGYIKVNEGTNDDPDYKYYGLSFDYKTPLKLHSFTDYKDVITDREYDFRLTIPRNMPRDQKLDWGDRMRGKTMQCEIKSNSNNLDFALQYVTTKFRMSWT